MKFTSARRDRRRDSEISLTPLIDLFLNILTFFLVTTTFASDSIFFVDLPDAKPGQALGDRKAITVNVDSKGQISVDRELISMEQLRAQLETIPKEKRATMPVALRADRDARHGQVVSVMETIRNAGLTNLGIVTQTPRN